MHKDGDKNDDNADAADVHNTSTFFDSFNLSNTVCILVNCNLAVPGNKFKVCSYQNLNSGNLLINGLNSSEVFVGNSGPSSMLN